MSKENDCEDFGNELTNIYPARGGGGGGGQIFCGGWVLRFCVLKRFLLNPRE